jgi:hypothetical protein
MLVLALQFSRCDRRLRNNRTYRARRSGVGDSDTKSDSLKTEEKTVAGVRSDEGGTESLSTSTSAHDSPPVHQLEVSRIGWLGGHQRWRDTP